MSDEEDAETGRHGDAVIRNRSEPYSQGISVSPRLPVTTSLLYSSSLAHRRRSDNFVDCTHLSDQLLVLFQR